MEEQLLDTVQEKLASGLVAEGMTELVEGLREIRDASEPTQWVSFVRSMCLTHPVRRIVHEDPFTWRSFSKPRGYPGDAATLDLIYFPAAADMDSLSATGRDVFRWTSSAPACEAVRNRRVVLARAIDEAAEEAARPRILSVACGHMREVELSKAIAAGLVGEVVALDQDASSLKVVEECYGASGIRAVPGSVRTLLRGANGFRDFDLVYSAGLYDYLSRDLAQRLTARLFSMVRPGGRLLIANFLPGIRDVGYMESYMDWNLIYRSESDMLDLLSEIPRGEIGRATLTVDDAQNVVFLQVRRR